MNDWLTHLTFYQTNSILLLAVIFAKAIIARYSQSEPLHFFSVYCRLLANKVNKPINSNKQQEISGLVAVVITLVPLVTILWLFADFISVTWLWQGLLLYLALGDFQLKRQVRDIQQALQGKQKHLAKQYLTPLVLRDVEPLSTMGLSKATIEMQLFRYVQHYFVIGFYFLLFGGLFALTVRLLFIMHHCWNTKLTEFKYFGQVTAQITLLLQWLPTRLLAFFMLISGLSTQAKPLLTLFIKHLLAFNNHILLALLAQLLQVRLAGVAMYRGEKVRWQSFNEQAPQPQINDICRANKLILHTLYFAIALTIIYLIATLSLH